MPAANPWDSIARECIEQVVSPIEDSEQLPLLSDLRGIRRRSCLVVGDLGCGTGTLLPHLVELGFGRVIAVDSSREMLARARARMGVEPPPAGGRGARIEFQRASLTRLTRFAESLDVAITLNSILMADPAELDRAFRAVRRALKPEGRYFGLFPALDSMMEVFRYCYRQELRRGSGSHRAAWDAVQRRLAADKMNFALGLFDAGYLLEKYFLRDELDGRLRQAGFRDIHFARVVYRPGLAFEGSETYGRGVPRVWHWQVACRA